MGFRFSLAAVLRLREIVEEREERALTELLRQIACIREQIESIDQIAQELRAGRESALSEPLPAADLTSFYQRLNDLKSARLAQEAELGRLEQKRLEQLAVYHEANRARRMLTDMKAGQRETWDADRLREEQKTADDLFLSRRTRNR